MDIITDHIEYGGGSQEPTEIIIHAMGEYIKDGKQVLHAVDFLKKYKLSAHGLIAPNGDIYRCRFDNEIAWHARGFNKNSLGYEFLVPGEHDYRSFVDMIKRPYIADIQMESGLMLAKDALQTHNINSIRRHSDVSPGRKVDPGEGFPFKYFTRNL